MCTVLFLTFDALALIFSPQTALSSQQLDSRKAEGSQRDLAQREAQIDRLTHRLQEESSKAASLRQQVADMTAHHVKVGMAAKGSDILFRLSYCGPSNSLPCLQY